MAYVIRYRSHGKKKYPRRNFIKGRTPLLLTIGALIVVISLTLYNGGLQWILPGNPEITAPAFEELMNALSNGASFSDAVTAFCREVIYSAQ